MGGTKRFQFWHEQLKKREPWYRGVLGAIPSFKTTSPSAFLDGLKVFWMHLNYLLAFSASQPFHRWRFFRHRQQQIALHTAARRLVPHADRSRVCVGYGDWNGNCKGVRGHPPIPVKSFKKAVMDRATVISVDEFKTSQVCSQCLHPLKEVNLCERPNDREVALKRSYAVLRCANSGCKANFWGRDVNAARNILAILVSRLSGMGIPDAFKRAEGEH